VRWPADPVALPLVSAVTLYRFFQEALVNVVKHAGVDDAELALEVRPDEVVATVRDRGPGFEPEQVRPDGGRHVGLGAAQRARPPVRTGRLGGRERRALVGTLVGCACRVRP
jgi:signal transduction histidine kinase